MLLLLCPPAPPRHSLGPERLHWAGCRGRYPAPICTLALVQAPYKSCLPLLHLCSSRRCPTFCSLCPQSHEGASLVSNMGGLHQPFDENHQPALWPPLPPSPLVHRQLIPTEERMLAQQPRQASHPLSPSLGSRRHFCYDETSILVKTSPDGRSP